MRAFSKVFGSILLCFLGILGCAEAQCPPLDGFLQKLQTGKAPLAADFPDIRNDCPWENFDSAGLARATARFARHPSLKNPNRELASVLRIIKDQHKEMTWSTNFLKFSQHLKQELASDFSITIPDDSDSNGEAFIALDSFIAALEQGEPVEPVVEPVEDRPCEDLKVVLDALGKRQIPTMASALNCSDIDYSDLSVALAPLVAQDLQGETSKTAGLIRNVVEHSRNAREPAILQDFGQSLQQKLQISPSQLPRQLAQIQNGDAFLARLLEEIRRREESRRRREREPQFGGVVLTLLALLTLANTALLTYLLRRNRKPNPLPDAPDLIGMKNTMESLKSQNDQTKGSMSSLEGRLAKLESNFSGEELADLKKRLGSIEGAYEQFAQDFGKWTARFSEIELRPPRSPISPGADSSILSGDIEDLKKKVGVLFLAAKQPSQNTLLPQKDSLDLEREVLSESWKKANRELTASLERAARDNRWQEILEPLLFQLPQAVPEDLKATFDAVLAPARDYHTLTTKISLIPRLVGSELPPLPPLENKVQELRRIRELAHLLAMTQNSNLVADRLNFRLERWITDQFLSFADLFMQRYQQAQLEDREAPLEPGLQIVRQVLKVTNLEPIELVLGQTVFDSTRHIGRSTTCDPRFSDGVIMGAVRNGFVQEGQQVFRQPEVIVNRIR